MYWFDLRPNGSPYNRPTHTLFFKVYLRSVSAHVSLSWETDRLFA